MQEFRIFFYLFYLFVCLFGRKTYFEIIFSVERASGVMMSKRESVRKVHLVCFFNGLLIGKFMIMQLCKALRRAAS